MAQPPNISTLQGALTTALISTTRTVSELCAEDLAFHRQLDPKVGQRLDRQNARLLELAEKLVHNAAVDGSGEDVKFKAENEDVKEVIDSQWAKVVDVIDGLLERADASLDEYSGAVKRGHGQKGSDTQSQAQASIKPSTSKINVLRQQDMPKPQLSFESPPNNQASGPWRPLLATKAHATVPLDQSIRITTSKDDDGNDYDHHSHPYATEIAAYTYPESVRTIADPVESLDWSSTTAVLVDTMEGVRKMLAELKHASEIAVDLEHHDFRTYPGLTSLMQISTRSKDYIVDTLKPWRQQLQILNEVFADPTILKVLHGSSMDIIWLQRDLGIYVVGLFDTYHASRALQYQRAGLDFLLSKFVNFQAQKKYQRADWRIRPLPDELFDYARSDTHFLLYIYDRMRNELIQASTPENDLLEHVLDRSKEEALQHYERPTYRDDGTGSVGWMKPLLSTPAMLSKEQFGVFKAVHAWRDQVAREEDESTAFIMPNHALFAVARNMPVDKASLFGTLQGVSLPVRLRADGLVALVNKAKEQGKDGPELNEALGIHLGKRKRAEPDLSVGAAVKRVQLEGHVPLDQNKLSTIVSTPDISHVRAEASTFWGATLPAAVRSTRGQVPEAASTARATEVCLALPLPHLTAQIFAEPHGPAVAGVGIAPGSPVSTAGHSHARVTGRGQAADDGDVFILRQAGGTKRRHHDVEDPQTVDGMAEPAEAAGGADDGFSVQANSDAAVSQKLSKKSKKRARKRERDRLGALDRGASSDGNGVSSPLSAAATAAGLGTDADVVKVDDANGVFDYATAQSVMHPAHAAADKVGKGKKKGNQGFDPYQKALNAPKGLPKKQKDSSGRSMTFAS